MVLADFLYHRRLLLMAAIYYCKPQYSGDGQSGKRRRRRTSLQYV